MIMPAAHNGGDDEENQQHEQSRPLLSEDNHTIETSNVEIPKLPLALQLLYGINGITLALPTTAYLYITNTRVQMPVSMLPSYAAIAFLPYSLKPLYAALSLRREPCSNHDHHHHHVLLSMLLLSSGLITAATAWIPAAAATDATTLAEGDEDNLFSVLLCCAAAFLRGILSAWPELLLEWTLVKYQTKFFASTAHGNANDRVRVASVLQAQAATARNIGSILAHAISFIIWFRQAHWNDRMVKIILYISGGCCVVGALIALTARVGANSDDDNGTQQEQRRVEHVESGSMTRSTSYNSCNCEEEILIEQSAQYNDQEPDVSPPFDTAAAGQESSAQNIRLVLFLQLTIILLALREPIQESTPHGSWFILVGGTVLALLLVSSAVLDVTAWKSSHYVGLYLILRNAVPTISYVMDSFVYTALSSSSPVILQVFSLFDMILMTCASWSYQRLFSDSKSQQQTQGQRPHQQVQDMDKNLLLKTIIFTTVLAGIASFGHLVTIHVLANGKKLVTGIIWTAMVKSIVNITSEWKFLPDVILATVSSTATSNEGLATYSSLISCIDFGGQLGALMLGVLVSWMGTSRDNDWAHMDQLVCIGACSCIASAALVVLMYPKKPR